MRSRVIAGVLCLVIAACSGGAGDEDPGGVGPGAETADAAVSMLLEHLKQGDFAEAAPLAIPGQAALASLAEGATTEDVATGLRDGDLVIATNFWSGFAQTVEAFLLDAPDVARYETVEVEGQTFELVSVASPGASTRTFTTRDDDGYRVDILATFGPSLASRLYPPVERLFTSNDPDAPFVLSALRDQVPSLHMAAQTPDLAPNVVQDILQLIELITRIN